ncbi:hypothetical protein Rhal01_03175 [Rubritalea halochordaticola]|uniref:Uncharacterized protein n=1 Tax=Rubritalea halochordaticola TaxID=714537 RepID=A0ABP9V8N4_9BACT
MNPVLKRVCDSATDAGTLAKSLAESGVKSVSEFFHGIRVFGAMSALTSAEVERDETHYLLVPVSGEEGGYAIYTKRILPPDVGVNNSLPKLRVFHIPDENARETMEHKLVADMVEETLGQADLQSDLADTLDKFADEIDKQTERVSGGLILIGGVVALANPLLGIGIAVKGLMPSIGAKASKAGTGFVTGKIRGWKKSTAEAKAQKEAAKEVKKLKPEVYTNPLLRALDALLTNPDESYDPHWDQRLWPDSYEYAYYYEMTLEAIREVYAQQDLPTEKPAAREWVGRLLERD